MLVEFVVGNFLSFKEETSFKMTAASGVSEHRDRILKLHEGKKVSLAPIGAVYGPNASGKSNLIKAMTFARHWVTTVPERGAPIPVKPFKLDQACLNKPSRFEFVFKHKGVLYHYGFLADSRDIREEWLFATRKSQEMKYFERVMDKQEKPVVEFGATFLDEMGKEERDLAKLVGKSVKHNQLLLNEAHERSIEPLEPVYEWFDKILTPIYPTDRYDVAKHCHDEGEFGEFLCDFLHAADTGIAGIEINARDIEDVFPEMPDAIKEKMAHDLSPGQSRFIPRASACIVKDESGSLQVIELQLSHKGEKGTKTPFQGDEESQGTSRMMDLIPMLWHQRNRENVFLIDELDASLHTLLARRLIQAFIGNHTDHPNQLIFTTHDTNLLDLKVLRRDEVFFMEKGGDGASVITPLSDFNIRKDLDIGKGYLQGRFNAIPLFGDLKRLGFAD